MRGNSTSMNKVGPNAIGLLCTAFTIIMQFILYLIIAMCVAGKDCSEWSQTINKPCLQRHIQIKQRAQESNTGCLVV